MQEETNRKRQNRRTEKGQHWEMVIIQLEALAFCKINLNKVEESVPALLQVEIKAVINIKK